MLINPKHKLHKLGSHYMIVDVCEDNANVTNVFVLNDTAAFLWEQVRHIDFSAGTLVDLLCDAYDIDRASASADVESLLKLWHQYNIVL